MIAINGRSDVDIEHGIQKKTWPEFAKELSQFIVSDRKDVASFIPVIAKPKEEWVRLESNLLSGKERSFRNQNNFSHITMAVLDLDEEGALEQATEKFKGVEYVIHSTYSYSQETPYKYRMIMPLENPIPVEQWERTFINLMAGINGDNACKNISRGYHLPSTNPANNIKGVFIQQEGRFLSQELIVELGEKYMSEKDVEALNKMEKKGYSVKSEKIHPSGFVIESKYNGDDLSYEGFSRRHKAKIDMHFDGKKGNRHAYAIDVINSEMGIFTDKTQFNLLIEFLYKSTLEHSTLPLSSGNTGNEIPEIIESGMSIMMPSEKLKDAEFVKSVKKQIEEGLQSAVAAEKTGNWSFQSVSYDRKLLGNSLKSFNNRYSKDIKDFENACESIVEKGSDNLKRDFLLAFNQKVVAPVIHREVNSNTQFNAHALGRFLFEMIKENNLGENVISTYTGLAKQLSKFIISMDSPVIKEQGLTEKRLLDDLLEVTVLSPLMSMVEQENKEAFKKKRGYGSTESERTP